MISEINDRYSYSKPNNAYNPTPCDRDLRPMHVLDLTEITDPVAKQELISQALARVFRVLEIQMAARAGDRNCQVQGKSNDTSMKPT